MSDWRGRPFPAFDLEQLGGGRVDDTHLRGRRAVIFCFASW